MSLGCVMITLHSCESLNYASIDILCYVVLIVRVKLSLIYVLMLMFYPFDVVYVSG